MEKLQIKLIALDVDGVLTDGRIIYTNRQDEIKNFNTQDGLALRIAKACGIKTAIITGRVSEIVQRRADELGIDHLVMGSVNKTRALMNICEKEGIALEHVAYMGDDLNDLGVLSIVGFPAAPYNGRDEARSLAKLVTERCGGYGAVREMIEFILKHMGFWDDVVKNFKEENYAK